MKALVFAVLLAGCADLPELDVPPLVDAGADAPSECDQCWDVCDEAGSHIDVLFCTNACAWVC